jgi:hypothetical protein
MSRDALALVSLLSHKHGYCQGPLGGVPTGSGLGSRSVLAGVVPRCPNLLCIAVLAGHAELALVSGVVVWTS